MTNSDIEKVRTVFAGIASRDADLATRYMHPQKYRQHNPHAADGVEGLREFIGQFPADNHHLKVVRVFQDGPYVFSQEEGLILGQGVFFDLFRFEDGLIVEHWVFTAPRGAAQPERAHADRRADRGETLRGHGEEQGAGPGLLPDRARLRRA